MTTSTPTTAPVTGWDRAVVIALGAAGCALSYDALQQMAIAIHVRGFLTYLFPLVIDGFISYGVRALLVLRDAPLRARIYVWTLFGAATGASLWANALHAVRMNEQSAATGLRLGDTVVAVLSTIAPLALAGAVHLYILIARGQVNPTDPDNRGDRATEADLGQVAVEADLTERPAALTGRQDSAGHWGAGQPVGRPVTVSENPPQPTPVSAVSLTTPADLGGHPGGAEPVTSRPTVVGQVTAPQVTDQEVSDRRTDLDTEELLAIAREAVEAEDKLTRRVVAQAIRGQQIPLSSATLTQLMAQLRDQHGQPVTASRS
ncbi:DUF2637 domain-containing protein [Kitasatospora sp. NPDC059747]|uniref:DUF2637 domain-containing protein n=1 Tax=Kitasatospora sp. NPDC059747 TaxID=3346930 RepID=UPI003664EEB4